MYNICLQNLVHCKKKIIIIPKMVNSMQVLEKMVVKKVNFFL